MYIFVPGGHLNAGTAAEINRLAGSTGSDMLKDWRRQMGRKVDDRMWKRKVSVTRRFHQLSSRNRTII
jgi:hypothetical protein